MAGSSRAGPPWGSMRWGPAAGCPGDPLAARSVARGREVCIGYLRSLGAPAAASLLQLPLPSMHQPGRRDQGGSSRSWAISRSARALLFARLLRLAYAPLFTRLSSLASSTSPARLPALLQLLLRCRRPDTMRQHLPSPASFLPARPMPPSLPPSRPASEAHCGHSSIFAASRLAAASRRPSGPPTSYLSHPPSQANESHPPSESSSPPRRDSRSSPSS